MWTTIFQKKWGKIRKIKQQISKVLEKLRLFKSQKIKTAYTKETYTCKKCNKTTLMGIYKMQTRNKHEKTEQTTNDNVFSQGVLPDVTDGILLLSVTTFPPLTTKQQIDSQKKSQWKQLGGQEAEVHGDENRT